MINTPRRLALTCLLASAVNTARAQSPIAFEALTSRPVPVGAEPLAYGEGPLHVGDWRQPNGRGPFPVAVLLHGGCWLAQYDRAYMGHLGAALAEQGIASWTPEFRRVGDVGGGWTGTFEDVAGAIAFLRTLARSRAIDTARVVLVGHSAGGHLALWYAGAGATPRVLSPTSPPLLAPVGVVTLAGIPDLRSFAAPRGCGAAVPRLLGGAIDSVPERLAAVSPAERPAPLARIVLVSAARDRIVTNQQDSTYAAHVATAGRSVTRITLPPDAGHFDLVAPWAPGFPAVMNAIRQALGLAPAAP